MEPLKIGKLIEANDGRDAIHVAIAPVIATEQLAPGQHVELAGSDGAARAASKSAIGIVDPFLLGPVFPGERFYMFLYPSTVTSLRHEWTHPAFGAVAESAQAEPQDKKAASEKWLREFAAKCDCGYNMLLEAANLWLDDEEYTTQLGSSSWRDNFEDAEGFWHHFEIVTGRKVEDHTATFFSCSC